MLRRSWVAMGMLAAGLAACQLVAGLYEPRKPHCTDGLQNFGETGVDCGDANGECPACVGGPCQQNTDCTSLECGDDGKCLSPDCNDPRRQCWLCHECGAGDPCATNADCHTGLCVQGECRACDADTRCPDDTACVGAECVAVTCHYDGSCGTGGSGGHGGSGTGGMGGAGGGSSSSSSSSSSTSSSSSSSSTSSSSSGMLGCSNGTKDGTETDTDCGGSCPPCIEGQTCTANGDCVSKACHQNVCLPTHCTNLVQDANESDVDCGMECIPCGTGRKCFQNEDCASLMCILGTPSTCL